TPATSTTHLGAPERPPRIARRAPGRGPSEAFALRPGDLDLKECTVRVERAVSMGRVKTTKTAEERVVDLTRDLAAIVARHLVALKAEALRRGWGDPEWLFPNEAGHLYDKRKL